MDEAFADLIEKRRSATPRAHVMGAYLASHEKYGQLYKKLAETQDCWKPPSTGRRPVITPT